MDNDGIDRFSNVPEDVIVNHILSRLEMLEIGSLRFMSRYFRGIASSQALAEVYNQGDGRSAWTFVLSMQAGNAVGWLHGYREEDGVSVSFNLAGPLGGFLQPGEFVALICAAGSFLVFRVHAQVPSALLVYNICRSSCTRIPCPPDFFTHASFWISNNIKLVLYPENVVRYTIVYVENDDEDLFYYQYDSEEERWSYLCHEANELADDDIDAGVQLGDVREMIAVDLPDAFLVCFDEGDDETVVYTRAPLEDLMDFQLFGDPNAGPFDERGWRLAHNFYYGRGRDGLMLGVERYVEPHQNPGRTRLHGIYVYRLNDGWNEYELFDAVPEDDIPHQPFLYSEAGIEQAGDTINITIVATDQQAGSFSYVLWRLNLVTGDWTPRRQSDWYLNAVLSLPVFSSRLFMPPSVLHLIN